MLNASDSMVDQFAEQLNQLVSVDVKRSESLCSRLADEFQNLLLDYDTMPMPMFNYFLTLISVNRYYEIPGIWHFIVSLNTPRDDFTIGQFQTVTSAFLENYVNYSNQDLCLATCDFIARHLQPSAATDLLRLLKIEEKKKHENLRGFADQGLYIVEQEIRRLT